MSLSQPSLGSKLLFGCVVTVLLSLPASNYWIQQKVRDNTFKLPQNEAQALGERYAQEVQHILDQGMDRASALASIVESQVKSGKPSRADVIQFLKRSMERNPNMAGYWLIAAPNAYDGFDDSMVNLDRYHDETGQVYP